MPISPWDIILKGWEPHLSVIIGSVLLAAAYLFAVGPLRRRKGWAHEVDRRQVISFLLGLLILLLALISPLDRLADEYLFSAHMAQHMLLIQVVPPLLLLGAPGWLIRPLIGLPGVARMARTLTRPVVAYLLFNAVFLIWHLPAFYDAALRNERVHIIQHLSFIITSLIAWWPVLGPLPEIGGISHPFKILYLFLQCLPITLLSALLVYSPKVLYSSYALAPRPFDISALADQQLGGLLMWVPGGLIYLLAISLVFLRWDQSEART